VTALDMMVARYRTEAMVGRKTARIRKFPASRFSNDAFAL
jgi:hypothetical protein